MSSPRKPPSPVNSSNKLNDEEVDKVRNLMIKYSDERDEVQKKTFTKWMNRYLTQRQRRVENLYEDLRDGTRLITLLEILCKCKLRRERGLMRVHHLQNVRNALDYLKNRQIKLVNIRSDDIVDGNPKLTLGLVWIIILSLQIEDIVVTDDDGKELSAKAGLLKWAQKHVEDDEIKINNFHTCWKDGKVFNAIINRHRPDLIDMDEVQQKTNYENLKSAFRIAEDELGVEALLDPEDFELQTPDERSIVTYVSALFEKFPEVPPKPQKVTYLEEYKVKVENFELELKKLSDWLKENSSEQFDKELAGAKCEEKYTEIKDKLNNFQQGELKDKLNESEELKGKLKQLDDLRNKLVQNKENLNEEDTRNLQFCHDNLNDVSQQLDKLNSSCFITLSRAKQQATKLNKKKKREAKQNEKIKKLNEFEETSLGDLFMGSTHEEITSQIERLNELEKKLTLTSPSGETSSSSSSDDDSTNDVAKTEDDVTKKHATLNNQIKEKLENSHEASEILHDLNTKCDDHQRWLDVNQKKFNDLMTSQSGTDNVTVLETLIEDCDVMIGKCDELFAKCADFNVVARSYDVTLKNVDDGYQRKCNQRMKAVQKRPNEILSAYSMLRTNASSELVLRKDIQDSVNRDRQSSCVSSIEILLKFESAHKENNFVHVESIEKQIQLFKDLDGEIPSSEATFSLLLDKCPHDVNMTVRQVMTSSSNDVVPEDEMETTIEEINTRWQHAKQNTKEKLKFLLICRAKLLFINGEVDQHRAWLDENIDVTHITNCDVTNPIQLDQAVQEIKKLKSVLEIRLKQQGNLRNNFAQFQQAAARFYEDNDVIDDEEKVPEEVAKRYKHVENKVTNLINDHENFRDQLQLQLDSKEKIRDDAKSHDVMLISDAYRVLRSCEKALVDCLPFPCQRERLDEYLDALNQLQLEIEANDSKFEEELPQRYHDNMQMRLLDIQHLIDDIILDDDVIVVSVEELIERWTIVRNQFKPRTKCLGEGRIEIEQFKSSIEDHQDWIKHNQDRSSIMNHVDSNNMKVDSVQTTEEINRLKEFKEEVQQQLNECAKLDEVTGSLEETASTYDRECYKFASGIPELGRVADNLDDLCDQSARSRQRDFYSQVNRLKFRYEALLKSLDSNIKKLSSICENAQKRESQICKQAYLILKSKERNLDNYDMITADVDRVEDMKKLLQELEDETAVCESTFSTMTSYCPNHKQRMVALYEPHHTSSMNDDEYPLPNDVTIDEIVDRWNDSKKQTADRLKLVKEIEPLLRELVSKLSKHKKWLDENSTTCDVKTPSENNNMAPPQNGYHDVQGSSLSPSSGESSDSDVINGNDINGSGDAQPGTNGKADKNGKKLKRSPSMTRKLKEKTEKLLWELSDRLTDSGDLLDMNKRVSAMSEEFDKIVNNHRSARRKRRRSRHQTVTSSSTSESSSSSSSSGNNDDQSQARRKRKLPKKKRRSKRLADSLNGNGGKMASLDLSSQVADVISRYNEMRENVAKQHSELAREHEVNVTNQLRTFAACKSHLTAARDFDDDQSHGCSLPVTVDRLQMLRHHFGLMTSQFTEDEEAKGDFEKLDRVFPDKNARVLQHATPSTTSGESDSLMTSPASPNRGEMLPVVMNGVRISPEATAGKLIAKWKTLKTETKERSELADQALEKLQQLEPEVQDHVTWLQENSNKIEDDDVIDELDDLPLEDCEVLENEINKMKDLASEVRMRLEKSRLMFQLTGEYDGFARKYYLITSPPASSGNHDNAEEESRKRMEVVEKKVKEVVKKYEDLSKQTVKVCKLQQEKLESARMKKIDDERMFEEKENQLSRWIESRGKDVMTSQVESGLCPSVLGQLDNLQAMENEMEDKRQELISLYGIPSVLGSTDGKDDEIHPLAVEFNKIVDTIEKNKEKLQEYLEDSRKFEVNFEAFQSWLSRGECYLNKEVERSFSVREEHLQDRYDDMTKFEKDIGDKRKDLEDLSELASKIRYFASRQDSLAVKNKMVSLRGRWQKLVPDSNEHFNNIASLLKQIQEFEDERNDLIAWCQQIGRNVIENCSLPDSLERDVILNYVAYHDRVVDEMTERKNDFESIVKEGKNLSGKTHFREDKEELKGRIDELKTAWKVMQDDVRSARNDVDEWAVFSSKLYDYIEKIETWLHLTQKELESQGRCNGDLQTVEFLMNENKVKLGELTTRCENLEQMRSMVEDDYKKDDQWCRSTVDRLSNKWDVVAELIKQRQEKLNKSLEESQNLQHKYDQFVERMLIFTNTNDNHCDVITSSRPNDDIIRKLETIWEENEEELEKERENLFEINEQITELIETSHPDAIPVLQEMIAQLETCYDHASKSNSDLSLKLKQEKDEMRKEVERMEKFQQWLTNVARDLKEKEENEQDGIPNDQLDRLFEEHKEFQKQLAEAQHEYDVITAMNKRNKSDHSLSSAVDNGSTTSSSASTSSISHSASQLEDGKLRKLQDQWKLVWFAALERQKKLDDAKEHRRRNLSPEEEAAELEFFDDWRKRYMKWKKSRKLRMMDLFRSVDTDQSGRLTHEQFTSNIIKSSFRTNRDEMERVCSIFDRDGDGFIDYYEFISALYPNGKHRNSNNDDDEYVEDEVCRQVSSCKCCKKFYVERVNVKPKNPNQKSGLMFHYKFGDAHQLRLVRVLSSVVMVRIGGGWQALEEFLTKNDPCRAKGRTNHEIYEKMILPSGSTQSMTPFKRNRTSLATPSPRQQTPKQRHTTIARPTFTTSNARPGKSPKTPASSSGKKSIPPSRSTIAFGASPLLKNGKQFGGSSESLNSTTSGRSSAASGRISRLAQPKVRKSRSSLPVPTGSNRK